MNNRENEYYGGFVFSKNIILGKPVRFTFREKSEIPELNGWTLYSCDDDENYIADSNNFQIVGVETIKKYAPMLLKIFNAPYGTDLCWLYKGGHLGFVRFVGFYDLKKDRETSIKEILGDSNGI